MEQILLKSGTNETFADIDETIADIGETIADIYVMAINTHI